METNYLYITQLKNITADPMLIGTVDVEARSGIKTYLQCHNMLISSINFLQMTTITVVALSMNCYPLCI
jgi:hypothetical protein